MARSKPPSLQLRSNVGRAAPVGQEGTHSRSGPLVVDCRVEPVLKDPGLMAL